MVKTGTVSIGTSATLIFTASGRTTLRIRNGNTAAVAVGNSSITFPGGWMLSVSTPEAIILQITLQDGESIYGASAAGGTVVNYVAEN